MLYAIQPPLIYLILERILIWLEIGWDIARLIQLTSTPKLAWRGN